MKLSNKWAKDPSSVSCFYETNGKGEIEQIITPPQSEQEVREYLSNLELYINDDSDGVDPLIKLAVIHYQFDAIHPFYDGNGRTGRILNVLYLVLKELLFFEFYTKIQYIEEGLRVSRKTAQGYLKQLEKNGFLSSQKIGRERTYCNDRLFRVVKESSKHKL